MARRLSSQTIAGAIIVVVGVLAVTTIALVAGVDAFAGMLDPVFGRFFA